MPALGQGLFPYTINTFSYKDNATTRINLNRELESFQKRGGLYTYVFGILLEFNLKMAGNVNAAAGIAAGDWAQLLREIFFDNWVHDIRLTGEWLKFWTWFNNTRYPFTDPAAIAMGAGNNALRKVTIVLPFYDENLDDEFQLVDPVDRYIKRSAQLNVSTAPVDWFDTVCKIDPANSSFTVKFLLSKLEREFSAAPFTWRFEDRTENPFLLNIDGVLHHLVKMQPPVKQTPGLPAITDTNYTLEPNELTQPNTPILDFIQNWEQAHKSIPSPDDVLAARYMDSNAATPVQNVVPLIIGSEYRNIQHSQMPAIENGQLKVTMLPSGNINHRVYYRQVRTATVDHANEVAQNFGKPNADIKRPNPGGKPMPGYVKNTARIIVGTGSQKFTSADRAVATGKRVT